MPRTKMDLPSPQMRSTEMPGTRCSESATFLSRNFPTSSALMLSTMFCALAFLGQVLLQRRPHAADLDGVELLVRLLRMGGTKRRGAEREADEPGQEKRLEDRRGPA